MTQTYSDRLKASMAAARINQSELARLVGIKPQAIQALCSGDGAQRSAYTAEIAWQLNVSSYWLATGRGGPLGMRPIQKISHAARMLAQSFDMLEDAAQQEFLDYMAFIGGRLQDPSDRSAIARLVEDIRRERDADRPSCARRNPDPR